MNIFKLRFLLTISMVQFIFGSVEVVTLAGDILELASGTVAQITAAISAQLGIEEWSVILSQGTKMLDDLTMTIADGEKLSMVVSKNPKTFATWISKTAPEIKIENKFLILDCRILHKSTDNGSHLEVEIDAQPKVWHKIEGLLGEFRDASDSLWFCVDDNDRPKAFSDGGPGLYSTNFPTNLAGLPLIFEKVLDGLSLNELIRTVSQFNGKDCAARLSEHYKDDAMMLAMIEFTHKSFSNQYRLDVNNSTVKAILFSLSGIEAFRALGQFIEILMG